MLSVFFESDKEVVRFCEQLFHYNKQIELHWKTHADWGNHLQFEEVLPGNGLNEVIAQSMVDVFITYRLNDLIKNTIEKVYYFTNADEIERILDLTNWLFAGEDEDSLQVMESKDPRQVLKSLFTINIENTTTIHFDSIVKFRLKAFNDDLKYYVGLAIEEFKREEDHQEFVNALREYISRKEPGMDMIHVLQGENFAFFKQDGKHMSNMELQMIMQKEPLYLVGLDTNEWNLAPLIAMTPEKIKIYGKDPSEPKTLTIINVFQERVDFEGLSNFPFPYKLKNKQ
ncbi:putative sporulation protein YtxC [Virgibacillus ainsalahensis]